MPDYPDTPEGREAKLLAEIKEMQPQREALIAKQRAEREKKEEDARLFRERLHAEEEALLNEFVSIPVICSSCKESVGIREGTRRDVLGNSFRGKVPVSFSGTCDACKEKDRVRSVMSLLSLPSRYALMSFDNYDIYDPQLSPVFEQVRRLSKANDWIILCGKRGTGKTHLAISALKEAQSNNRRGHYLSAVTFIPYLVRSGYNHEEVWEKNIKRYDSLVLDDLGQGEASKSDGDLDERARQDVGAIIDFYYRNNGQIIITTNIESPKELIDRYGSWAIDRMLECGEFVKMPDLPSMRPSIRKGGV